MCGQTLLIVRWLLALVCVVSVSRVWACSSCGSGGGDPLILYPSDTWRSYLGVSQQTFQANVDPEGQRYPITGIAQRTTSVLGLGRRLTEKSFMVAYLPYVRNTAATKHQSGLGDPSIAYRWTMRRGDLTRPDIPQVQLMLGFKPRYATGTLDADDQRTYLDARGSGYDEGRVGVDLWSAMRAFQYGMSINQIIPRSRIYRGTRYHPGDTTLANVTVGYGSLVGRIVTGLVYTRRGERTVDDQSIPDSASRDLQQFLTGSWRLQPLTTLRATWVASNTGMQRRNTSDFRTLTLAVMRTL